jgi:hypothetical protein
MDGNTLKIKYNKNNAPTELNKSCVHKFYGGDAPTELINLAFKNAMVILLLQSFINLLVENVMIILLLRSL